MGGFRDSNDPYVNIVSQGTKYYAGRGGQQTMGDPFPVTYDNYCDDKNAWLRPARIYSMDKDIDLWLNTCPTHRWK